MTSVEMIATRYLGSYSCLLREATTALSRKSFGPLRRNGFLFVIWCCSGLAGQACLALGASDVNALIREGRAFTPEQAQKATAELDRSPDDLSVRTRLLVYHWFKRRGSNYDMSQHRLHAMWIIRNRPDLEIAGYSYAGFYAVKAPDAHAEAKGLWLEHVSKETAKPVVLHNAAHFFRIFNPVVASELLERAVESDPTYTHALEDLGRLHLSKAIGLFGGIKSDIAQVAMSKFEAAFAQLTATERLRILPDLARAAYLAGDLTKAQRYGENLLEAAVHRPATLDHGVAVHHGNLVLGLVALTKGEVERAEEYLLKAGKTPGSPELDYAGPNVLLAQELLKRGRRKAVIEYLDNCRRFWKRGGGKLRKWIKIIEEGGIPRWGRYLQN